MLESLADIASHCSSAGWVFYTNLVYFLNRFNNLIIDYQLILKSWREGSMQHKWVFLFSSSLRISVFRLNSERTCAFKRYFSLKFRVTVNSQCRLKMRETAYTISNFRRLAIRKQWKLLLLFSRCSNPLSAQLISQLQLMLHVKLQVRNGSCYEYYNLGLKWLSWRDL